MAKVDKETASKELKELLSLWSDGLDLPDFSGGDKTDEGKQRQQFFDSAVSYISAGKIIVKISDEAMSIKNGDDWLDFGVPMGDAFMDTAKSSGVDFVGFAEKMCKKQPGYFANRDARLTKKAVIIAGLFIFLP